TNVLGRLLGIPHRPKEAVRMLADGYAVGSYPTIEVSGDTGDERWSARAVFALGVGPDAAIVAAAETEPYRKYRFGSIHYATTALRIVWKDLRSREPDIAVSTGHVGIGAMAQFHGAYTYFGRVPLRLDATAPDPMSVLTIERLPIRRAGGVVRRAARGTLEKTRGLHLDRNVESFTVDADSTVEVQMDGEHYGQVRHLSVIARPQSLRVAVPG
ncbi:MAG: hypothetical protein R3246_13100, partial [Acidimicrobiia bacterium]|nr:hypothetical protein [Acidimicrobiia bacterium]